MDRSKIHSQLTILEILNQHPETRHVFQSLKTSCVGCRLARFCTLQDVAEAYEIPPQVMLDGISNAVNGVETENPSRSN